MEDIEVKRGMAAALRVASCLVYDEPIEEGLLRYIDLGVFEEPPFDSDDPALRRGLDSLSRWCHSAQTEGCSFSEEVAVLQRDYLRLFVGCGVPLAPSWATFYSDANHQILGSETLEVRNCYRQFGLQVDRLNREPDDHLGLMMRFLAHVLLLECEAAERGDRAESARLFAVQETFLCDHVLPWLPAWSYSVQRGASSEYYRGCGDFVFGLLREYALMFGVAYREEPPSFVKRCVELD